MLLLSCCITIYETLNFLETNFSFNLKMKLTIVPTQCCQFALCNDITWFTKEPTASESYPPTKGPETPPRRGPAFEPNPQNSLTYPLYIVGIFVFIIGDYF